MRGTRRGAIPYFMEKLGRLALIEREWGDDDKRAALCRSR